MTTITHPPITIDYKSILTKSIQETINYHNLWDHCFSIPSLGHAIRKRNRPRSDHWPNHLDWQPVFSFWPLAVFFGFLVSLLLLIFLCFLYWRRERLMVVSLLICFLFFLMEILGRRVCRVIKSIYRVFLIWNRIVFLLICRSRKEFINWKVILLLNVLKVVL